MKNLFWGGYILVVCLSLLIAIEWVCMGSLKSKGIAQSFFFSNETKEEFTNYYQGFRFDLIDPLLGWGRTPKDVTRAGYTFDNDCVSLENTRGNITIIVTGGSTSDVILHPENWPILLQKLLNENQVSAKVVVAAVGGYNSGQELFKMVRDGITCNPTIHISYCGANEVETPAYVSEYEYAAYKDMMNGSNVPALLPNTVMVIRSWIYSKDEMHLKQQNEFIPFDFYARNMQLMYGISYANNYTFLGILQPVVNSGSYQQPEVEVKNDWRSTQYKENYPAMKLFADSTPYMANFSNVFDTCTGKVFLDDCHLTDGYQKIIAVKVYDELVKRNLLTTIK